jgi:hypothetical protein
MTESPPQLRWTLKRSFVEYVARMPDGLMSTTDGADAEGVTFTFEHEETLGDSQSGSIRFRGDVRFAGHGGLLFVCVAHPTVDHMGDRATVSIQLPGSSQRSAERVDIGSGRWENVGGERFRVSALKLTVDGSDLFAGVYPPGDELDDIALVIPGMARSSGG